MDKKKWEKPELIKMGFDMDHCCVVVPGSPGGEAPKEHDNPGNPS